jgi:hypothetical protein
MLLFLSCIYVENVRAICWKVILCIIQILKKIMNVQDVYKLNTTTFFNFILFVDNNQKHTRNNTLINNQSLSM